MEANPVCECDLGVGAWSQTEARMGVYFLPSFSDDDVRLVARSENVYRSAGGTFFFSAFSPFVWLAIAGLIVFFSILKFLDPRWLPDLPDVGNMQTESKLQKFKYFLLKEPPLYRARKAIQSVCKFFATNLVTSKCKVIHIAILT